MPSARPLAAQGNTALSYSMPLSFASVSESPIHATSGSVYATLGMVRASQAWWLIPVITSAASFASWVALCASMGSPTMSPIAKMCGTLVRIWLSTGIQPRSFTLTPAFSAPMWWPLGRRPTARSTRS